MRHLVRMGAARGRWVAFPETVPVTVPGAPGGGKAMKVGASADARSEVLADGPWR